MVFLVAVGCLQLLLYEARSMLVPTELDHMIEDISQLVSLVRFVAHAEFFQQGTANDLPLIWLPWWHSEVSGVTRLEARTVCNSVGSGQRMHPRVRRWYR